MATVSVIIPTYNCDSYIAESLQSILGQTKPPTEIIVIDDGSTDSTGEVVSSISDSRITYVRKTNGGISSALNSGLSLATGDYIAFLDADDRWLPGMLEFQTGVLDADPSLVASFVNFVRFYESTGERLPDQFQFCPEVWNVSTDPMEGTSARRISGNPFVALVEFGEVPAYLQCVIFRKSFIPELTFNPLMRRCQDLEFFLRAVARGNVAFAPDVFAEIRRHGRNITNDTSLMAVDKLEAFRSARSAPLDPQQLRALDMRIARANVDAAVARIRSGLLVLGVRKYISSLCEGRGVFRKLRGLARVGITAVGL